MGLDIDKILKAPREEIGQNDLKRLKVLEIISENIYPFNALERSKKQYWVKKCKYDGQSFFIFYYFVFDSDLNPENNINLEKYLQSDEPNIILQDCLIGNQKDIKNLNKIKQAIIAINSEFPNISSCEFENEVFLRDISNNSAFGGCEFAKEVYVDGYAYFHACTFNSDFISKNARQDISFASSIFNKSFKLDTKNELGEVKFEAAYFKQKFTMDIGKFSVLDFSSAEFYCELNLHARQFDGININFTNAKFNQKLSFNKSIINCEMLFKEACFEGDLIFTEAKFDYVVNLDKSKFKGKAQFRGTKFSEAILTKTTFENKADFSNAKFNEKAYFTNAVFKADADFSSATFADEARFLNANFKGVAIFKNAEFKAKADFKTDINLTFGKDVNFSNTTFQDNAYFNNRVFEEFVDFHEADFKKVACFYSVAFKKPVNFSSIIFNGALNFVNAKTDFTYEELKELIETQIKRDKSINNISATNDFRDGFRLMKYALNNKGNALDASLFHRLELYCKELELEFTLENAKAKNSENSKEVKSVDEIEAKPKSKSRIELFLDLITLKLYRNTSDHHTNLFKIINFTILSIAVYGLSFWVLDNFLLKAMIDSPKILMLLLLSIFLIGLLACLLYLTMKYKIRWATVPIGIFIYVISIIPGLVNAFDYSIYVVIFILLYVSLYALSFYLFRFGFVRFMAYLIFMAIFLDKPVLITPFIGIFTSEKIAESKFEEYIIKYNNNGLDDMLLDANFTNIKAEHKINFIVKNRKIILERLDNSRTNTPLIDFVKKYIKYSKEPMDNNTSYKNLNETTKKSYEKALNALKYDETMQSIQKSANLLYVFIMLLVIYSLTKTARRNSVVPS
ncbi:pentapeptide repeat-containing protein [Campylobacter concisus]|uniref:pentapeptide repeat-containing protein n=1 Tax=Campylobacter concisus TaxID=199 RepID=UPI0018AB334A|nr:pentapeptide repeat-containing protein [Campylobacter concisus]QPI00019.1 pentapeptide repeat-containing protein [Campylobacter concisus]QPI01809.1 pentapeptide repeat-containing protein [Campylobacter concisus]